MTNFDNKNVTEPMKMIIITPYRSIKIGTESYFDQENKNIINECQDVIIKNTVKI